MPTAAYVSAREVFDASAYLRAAPTNSCAAQ
jgi:hypothetical protein